MDRERKILFVRSGGGMPGLDIHVGLWRALADAGIESTHCTGTSAGAIVAAFDAAGMTSVAAEHLLRNLDDSDVRDETPFWKLRVPWLSHWLGLGKIHRLLHNHLPKWFDELRKPLAVYATHARSGISVPLNDGPVCMAVLASMAIFGVFPEVTLGEDEWCDGGTDAYVPLPDDWRDYDEVWILIARRPIQFARKKGILTRLMRNVDWMFENQVRRVLREVQSCTVGTRLEGAQLPKPAVYVLRPDVGSSSGSLRFSHGLIFAAYAAAQKEIQRLKGTLSVCNCDT